MLNEELKELLTGLAEKPASNAPFVAAVFKWARPEVLEFYREQSLTTGGAPEYLQRHYLRSESNFDFESLAKCAPGTLGYAYYRHIKDNNLNYDLSGHPLLKNYEEGSDLYYVTYRGLEIHDLLHVVADYGVDAFGEWGVAAFTAAQRSNLTGLTWLPILLTRIAFVAPESTFAVMDTLTDGWLRGKKAKPLLPVAWEEMFDKPLEEVRRELNIVPPAPREEKLLAEATTLLKDDRQIPPALKAAFWAQVEGLPGTGNIIEDISNFVKVYDDNLRGYYSTAMSAHKGVPEAFQDGFLRPPLEIESLHDYPEGSLGGAYYRWIVGNGLKVEILKGNQVVEFRGAVQDYTGQRILQTHDLWHCLTEYTTDGLDEIALQAFQLAQLGSAFSSNLLAMLITRDLLYNPQTLPYLMQAISEGWWHGRNTPPLIPVHWEQHWADSVEELRRQYQIAPHTSNFMAVV